MANFQFQERSIKPGESCRVDMPISLLSNHIPVHLPVHILHGRRPGPVLFLSGVVHGDEIIGVEIIRRVRRLKILQHLRGTLFCIPIVNAHGFIARTRYLPDRRDLNRSFPGSATGSMAAQLANLFVQEVIARSHYGIDIHSATVHRRNLPQIRIIPGDESLQKLARAFRAPLVIEAPLRPGSMREAASNMGVKMMLFEAGEGLRLDDWSVRVGVRGILGVMRSLGMIPPAEKQTEHRQLEPLFASKSHWVRAPMSGLLQTTRTIGHFVEVAERMGLISDPIGDTSMEVRATHSGLIIGRAELPVVNQGDALFHVALTPKTEAFNTDPLFDEDEIV
ncbi:MAG: succinylglutamate desuccinylase/aspartoacylase family protein [Magnetococcales bacterium]|nr:succinylglutamate desuccinylase/aspartoacylase family protein [Magnetococcales bacterium]